MRPDVDALPAPTTFLAFALVALGWCSPRDRT